MLAKYHILISIDTFPENRYVLEIQLSYCLISQFISYYCNSNETKLRLSVINFFIHAELLQDVYVSNTGLIYMWS